MAKWLTDLMQIIVAVAGLVICQEDPGNGPTKKQAVLDAVNAKLDEPGGIDRPAWLSKDMLNWLLGFLIDKLVDKFNKMGVFQKSAA